MAEFTMLYSGSSGNSALLRDNSKYLLIDMGKSAGLTNKKLKEIDADINNLMGILITHEHSDHIAGLNVFLKKHNIPIYSKRATLDFLYYNNLVPNNTKLIDIDENEIDVGGFGVKAFSLPHDAVDCAGYKITTQNGKSLAYASDLGIVNETIFNNLNNSDIVCLEANYDYNMLIYGYYPDYLKRRINSEKGHLKNEDSAKTLFNLHVNGCNNFMLCHISDKNNTPTHVLNSVRNEFIHNDIIPNKMFKVVAAKRHDISQIICF